jgi:diguanylate cyclase (GGDEF)-like protein/putative nucleotidyltransferase with HDIG domain
MYVAISLLCAGGAVFWSTHYPNHDWLLFTFFLLAVLLSSGLKIALPRGDGGMSLNFPFIFLAAIQLSPQQAILLGAISIAAQCRVKVKKIFTAIQIIFNVASTMCATGAACATYLFLTERHMEMAPALALGSVAYFLVSTSSVALVIASSTGEKAFPLWKKEFPWYLPFYVVGAGLAAMTNMLAMRVGWMTSLLLIPMVYTLYRAYSAQMVRLKERAQHLDETHALHLRTIEGLSMAIEAKDQNTHEHLFRVRNYVEEIGRRLGLSDLELQALHTAAFLHDIGKLAVPEHIINKPGKLTPEEFEKIKIHPVVGADILERVRFPYPVVPIVRSHHEWWDGTGYPDGLKGEAIPIGARVLSAADCFDALVSERPYRKGWTVGEALALVKRMSGTQFDPKVVAVLVELYESMSEDGRLGIDGGFTPLNTQVEVWRGEAPGAGFEGSRSSSSGSHALARESTGFSGSKDIASLNLIAAASQEAQALFEMNQSLGVSLSLTETISVMASRLQRLIAFDSCALFLRTAETLSLRYVDGENAKFFSREPINLGEGISGWVAQSGKSILNGDAHLETCYLTRVGTPGELQSALSIPLFDLQEEIFGVLTLYSMTVDSFQRDHLRILQAMSSKLSLSLQNSLHFRRAETNAETDFLTGLPNARRLFLQLADEVDRCQTCSSCIGVVVCDLNRFKDVNDQRGHLAGNRFLALVAEGFRNIAQPGDTVARMGGDEFVFLLRNLNEANVADRLAEIAETVRATSRRASLGITVTASLGAALYPEDGVTAEELLALADRRMYHDKKKTDRNADTSINVVPVEARVLEAARAV